MGDVVRFAHGQHVGITLGAGHCRSVAVERCRRPDGAVVVGARASIGSRIGATGGLFYTPGYVQAEGRGMLAARSYRAMAGVYIRSTTLGLTLQEVGRGAR